MRYLVLADVHANLEALEAVIADAGAVDAVVFLGDLVGYGPNPNECADRLRGLPNVASLVGNHDLAALARIDLSSFNPQARAAAEWTAAQLRPDVRAYLEGLSPTGSGEGFVMAHASPRDPVWEYLEFDYQGPANFRSFQGDLCFVGHTHVPRVFEQTGARGRGGIRVHSPEDSDRVAVVDGRRRIVNPGGVGQPRDGDPRAAYGLWDIERGEFQFHRVSYPIETTQEKILAAGLPPYLAMRLSVGM